jgi:hypothetical protein
MKMPTGAEHPCESEFENKRVLVTGGAKGIGEAIAAGGPYDYFQRMPWRTNL